MSFCWKSLFLVALSLALVAFEGQGATTRPSATDSKLQADQVEQLARRLRLMIYRRYRQHRSVYESHMQLLESVVAEWESLRATEPISDRPHTFLPMQLWLERATVQVSVGQPLPARPYWGPSDHQIVPRGLPSRNAPVVDLSSPLQVPISALTEPSSLQRSTEKQSVKSKLGGPNSAPEKPKVKKQFAEERLQSFGALPHDTHTLSRALLPESSKRPTSITTVAAPPDLIISRTASHSKALSVVAPEPSRNLRPTGPRAPQSLTQPVPPQPARIDLEMLRQRIHAYNLAIDAVEDQLRNEEPRTAAQLDATFQTLDEVLRRREVWQLYWNLVDPQEQEALGLIQPAEHSLEFLRQRLFETQVALDSSSEVTKESVSFRNEKQRLDEISDKVERWKTKLYFP